MLFIHPDAYSEDESVPIVLAKKKSKAIHCEFCKSDRVYGEYTRSEKEPNDLVGSNNERKWISAKDCTTEFRILKNGNMERNEKLYFCSVWCHFQTQDSIHDCKRTSTLVQNAKSLVAFYTQWLLEHPILPEV